MIVFPVISALLSAMCAIVVALDARRKPRPDKVVWVIAFVMFALAAGADAAGRGIAWTPWLARIYYATGPALVVAFLAIGQAYLLGPRPMARFGVGGTLLVTALWVSMVWSAPIDGSRLAEDGWDAIERGPELVALAIAINSIGTVVIVGGTAWTALRFRRDPAMRHRVVGCALICAGTLVVAAGGSLTRLGQYEYLYIAMSIGVGLIFLGVLRARGRAWRPDRAVRDTLAETASAATRADPALRSAPNPAIVYLEAALIPLDDAALDRVCAEWSVPREPSDSLSRHDARRAWRLRGLLHPDSIQMFDAHTVGARRQLAVLYHEVLAWDRSNPEEIAELLPSSDAASRTRQVRAP